MFGNTCIFFTYSSADQITPTNDNDCMSNEIVCSTAITHCQRMVPLHILAPQMLYAQSHVMTIIIIIISTRFIYFFNL